MLLIGRGLIQAGRFGSESFGVSMFGFEGMMPSKVSTLGTQFLGRDAVAYTFVKPHA